MSPVLYRRLFTALPGVILWLSSLTLAAQSISVLEINQDWQHYDSDTRFNYAGYVLPPQLATDGAANQQIEFRVRGADGGIGQVNGDGCRAKGGEGAYAHVALPIGTGDGQIHPGGSLRFVAGYRGHADDSSLRGFGDGGGGTAVFYTTKVPVPGDEEVSLDFGDAGTKWVALVIAGGGGGGYRTQFIACQDPEPGQGGQEPTHHADLASLNTGGGTSETEGGGGGGLTGDAENRNDFGGRAGFSVGASSHCCTGWTYGAGSGGGGGIHGGGGGGGRRGGNAGDDKGGRSGKSYVVAEASILEAAAGGQTFNPINGYIEYKIDGYALPVARCQPVVVVTPSNGTAAAVTGRDLDDGSSADERSSLVSYEVDLDGGCGGDLRWGNQSATLTVTDAFGERAQCTSTVVVDQTGNTLPTLDAGAGGTRFDFTGSAQDYLIPGANNREQVTITLKGADGGNADLDCGTGSSRNRDGGRGGLVSATFDIGCGAGELEPGGTLRFIVGEQGRSQSFTAFLCIGTATGGGGGGTAVLYRGVTDCDWQILMVAGAGGGAQAGGGDDYHGQSAIVAGWTDPATYAGGGDDENLADSPEDQEKYLANNGEGGKTQAAQGVDFYVGGGGGGAYGRGANVECVGYPDTGGGRAGFPNGGAGGKEGAGCSNQRDGGWGFGGGGGGLDKGGGGGGYSGGWDEGGGGSSYINVAFSYSNESTANNERSGDGYAHYRFETNTKTDPALDCPLAHTVYLDDQGQATVRADDINVSYTPSGDCGRHTAYFLSPGVNYLQNVDCNWLDLPIDDRQLKVVYQEQNGGTAQCTTVVTVRDDRPPTLTCVNTQVDIDGQSAVTLDLTRIATGVSDQCGADGVTLSAPQTVFDCADVGAKSLVVTAKDAAGNTSTCTRTVFVVNRAGVPTADCFDRTVSVAIDETIRVADLYPSNANTTGCGDQPFELFTPATLDCSNLGSNTVTYLLQDEAGQEFTCNLSVTVQLDGDCLDNATYDFSGQKASETFPASDLLTGAACGSASGGSGAATTVTVGCTDFTNEGSVFIDRAESALNFDHHDALTFGDRGELTVEFWIKPAATQRYTAEARTVVGKVDRSTGNHPFLIFLTDERRITYQRRGSGGSDLSVTSARRLSADVWQHVAVLTDGSSVEIYVNGTRTARQTGISAPPTGVDNDASVTVGSTRGYYQQNVTAHFDELRIWGDVRTPAELTTYRTLGLRGDEADLLLYATFEETDGINLNDFSPHKALGYNFGLSRTTDVPPVSEEVALREITLAGLLASGNCTSDLVLRRMTANNCALALPLDLLSFTGRAAAKTNELAWATANEEGFARFVVQRSADGQSWADLGAVAGGRVEGSSGGRTPYSYTDSPPPATAYYRLRMEDLDGSATHSFAVRIARPAEAADLRVYPNPSNGRFTVRLPLSAGGVADLYCYDLAGRLRFRVSTGARYEQREPLPAGLYLLTAELAGGRRVTQRVVVQ